MSLAWVDVVAFRPSAGLDKPRLDHILTTTSSAKRSDHVRSYSGDCKILELIYAHLVSAVVS